MGTTFEENAQIKAKAIAKYLPDDIILADDSGLEIDYLNKEPGIYSARYAGVDTSYDIKNQMLLDRLKGVPDEKRTARFVCAIAAAFPDGTVETVRGTIEGMIGYEIAGEHGFGYDPNFLCSRVWLHNSRDGPGTAKMNSVTGDVHFVPCVRLWK